MTTQQLFHSLCRHCYHNSDSCDPQPFVMTAICSTLSFTVRLEAAEQRTVDKDGFLSELSNHSGLGDWYRGYRGNGFHEGLGVEGFFVKTAFGFCRKLNPSRHRYVVPTTLTITDIPVSKHGHYLQCQSWQPNMLDCFLFEGLRTAVQRWARASQELETMRPAIM